MNENLAVATTSNPISPILMSELTIDEVLEALRHFECQQNPEELARMLEIVNGKTSLLEIGSNFGGTLKRMAEVLAPKSKVVSVDLPEPMHKLCDPLVSLKANCQKIANMGHNVKLFTGDSHNPIVIDLVKKEGPFDFCFIDGDHSYEGVKKDWQDYGPLAKIVGFHDICGMTDGCVRFWKELKDEQPYRMVEINYPRQFETKNGWMHLGIGIVFRE